MARKYQGRGLSAATLTETSAANLRLPRAQMAAVGFPSRLKKLHTPRRRLPVTIFYDPAAPVKIRHIDSNLGSVLGKNQSPQSQPIKKSF